MNISTIEMLLRLLQIMSCNAHAITFLPLLINDPLSILNSVVVDVGSGIYATMSLANHACYPNAMRQNLADHTLVLRAQRPILAGHHISDNYGTLSPISPHSDRRLHLALAYNFTCKCYECTNDTPTFQQLGEQKPRWRCQKCCFPSFRDHLEPAAPLPKNWAMVQTSSTRLHCPSCKNVQYLDLPTLKNRLQRISDVSSLSELMLKNVEAAHSRAVENIQEIQQHLVSPNLHEYSMVEYIKQIYNVKSQALAITSEEFEILKLCDT